MKKIITALLIIASIALMVACNDFDGDGNVKRVQLPVIANISDIQAYKYDEIELPQADISGTDETLDVTVMVFHPNGEEHSGDLPGNKLTVDMIGVYRVIYLATDSRGTVAQTSFKIFVSEPVCKPDIILLEKNPYSVKKGGKFNIIPAVSYGIDGNEIMVSIYLIIPDTQQRMQVSAEQEIQADIAGTYTIIYYAEDGTDNYTEISEKVICYEDDTPGYVFNGFDRHSDIKTQLMNNGNFYSELNTLSQFVYSGEGSLKLENCYSSYVNYDFNRNMFPNQSVDFSGFGGLSFTVYPKSGGNYFAIGLFINGSLKSKSFNLNANEWNYCFLDFSTFTQNELSSVTYIRLVNNYTETYIDEMIFHDITPTIEIDGTYPEQVAIGDSISVIEGNVTVDGQTSAAVYHIYGPNGAKVTTDSNGCFIASQFGTYTIEYLFDYIDTFGETKQAQHIERILVVGEYKPQPENLLQGFESGINASKTYIHNNSSTKVEIISVADEQYVLGGYRSAMIQLDNADTLHLMAGTFIGAQDFRDYKSITINMHSSASFYLGAISMVWGSKTAALTAGQTLVAGWNAITITFDWNALAENSGYNGENIYSFRMYFGCTSGAQLYFDNITYEYKDPEVSYKFELNESVLYGSTVFIPDAQLAYQGLTLDAEVTVVAPDGNDVAVNDKQFTASQFGVYNVYYTFKSEGVDVYTATRIIMAGYAQPQDLLQGFDGVISQSKTYIKTVGDVKVTTILNTNPSYVLGGGGSLKAQLTTDATYLFVLSNFLGTQNLREYSSITLNMYCGKSYYRGQISLTWTSAQSNNNTDGSYVAVTAGNTSVGWNTISIPLNWTALDAAGNANGLYAIRFYLGCTEGDTLYFDNITFQK